MVDNVSLGYTFEYDECEGLGLVSVVGETFHFECGVPVEGQLLWIVVL